jgi:hypothetical protein
VDKYATNSKEEMAYRFTQRKIAPVKVTAAMVNTTSMKDFPALGLGSSGSGSGSGSPAIEPAKKLDFKKVTTIAVISKVAPQSEKSEKAGKSEKTGKPVVPSSRVVTHCYDEFGEDFDGEEEPWTAEAEADPDQEFNANLMEIGTRRNAW